MDLEKINEQLKPKPPSEYNPSRKYGVMGICLGGRLHERLSKYAKKNNFKMSRIIRILLINYLDEMEEKWVKEVGGV